MIDMDLGINFEVAVIGNVAFDVLCYPVNEVPRHHSLTFDRAAVAPGGCGSNSAIGLAAQKIPTALIACIGRDLPGDLALGVWHQFGVHTDYIIRVTSGSTGISVGLVDTDAQPRFIHTSGTNQFLTPKNIPLEALLQPTVKAIHFAGYFLMAGMLDINLGKILSRLRMANKMISLDVQQTARLSQPDILWHLLPEIDYFSCNLMEATQLTGCGNERMAADYLHNRGARTVIVKLGQQGCYLSSPSERQHISAPQVKSIDTTGAGDAFSAGLIAALLRGDDLNSACRWANAVAANIVTQFGAVAAWENYHPEHIKELINGSSY